MNGHPEPDELQDLAAGSLDVADRTRIERHLEGCAECRVEVDTVRALLRDLADLPKAIQPARDLRPGIWRRIDGGVAPRAGTAREFAGARSSRGFVARRWPLAAAAVAVIALTVSLFTVVNEGPGTERPAQSALGAAEARFDAAARELETVLSEQRALLSPATRAVLDSSLAVLDAAVAEARAALAEDPGNAMLARMLMAAWEKKLGVLRAASEAPVGI